MLEDRWYILLPVLIITTVFAFIVFRKVRKLGANNVDEGSLKFGWIALSVALGCAAYLVYIDADSSDKVRYYIQVSAFSFLSVVALVFGVFLSREKLIRESDRFMKSYHKEKEELRKKAISPEDRVKNTDTEGRR